MTTKEKCEAYAREKLPRLMELSFGAVVRTGVERIVLENRGDTIITFAGGMCFSNKLSDLQESGQWAVIGHPIKLNDWLEVLGKEGYTKTRILPVSNCIAIDTEGENGNPKGIFFDPITGQPLTDTDWEALWGILQENK